MRAGVWCSRLSLACGDARAAARFVRLASQFTASIRVARGSRELDGKSILGLLLLAPMTAVMASAVRAISTKRRPSLPRVSKGMWLAGPAETCGEVGGSG